MPWLRLYVETIQDRKIRRLQPEHRWLWIVVLCLARQSPTPGRLMVAEGQPCDLVDLADAAALTKAQVKAGVTHMLKLGLIAEDDKGCWSVPAWSSRQPESDVSTDRVRAFRERSNPSTPRRSSNADETANGTFQGRSSNGLGNAPETETETDLSLRKVPSPSSAEPVDPSSGSARHPDTEVPGVVSAPSGTDDGLNDLLPANHPPRGQR